MIFFVLIFSVFVSALPFPQFGGTSSSAISGNTVIDFCFAKEDSLLFVLTTQGLSYTNPYRMSGEWRNFSANNFPGVHLLSVAASDSAIFVSGYSTRNNGIYGGKLFVKNSHSSNFREFNPSFRPDDDEFYRTPASIAVGDSFVFVSLNQGALMRNKKNPTSDNNWRVLLIASPASIQTEIQNNLSVTDNLTRYADSFSLVTNDTVSVNRIKNGLLSDTAFSSVHFHLCSLSNTKDTVTVLWRNFFFLGDTFKTDTATIISSILSFDSAAQFLADSIIVPSVNALLRYNDTLRNRYDSLTAELLLSDYPPAGYNSRSQIYDIRWHSGLLFSGWVGGLTVSSDNGKTQKGGLFGSANSVLRRSNGEVQIPSRILVQPALNGSAFRLFVKTLSDTVAVSAWLPDASIDSVSLLPVHLDSLKIWSFVTEGAISDIAVFNDSLFVAYGKNSANGIRKYYSGDTTVDNKTVTRWVFRTIPLTGFLEPQLGANTILAVALDSAQYELWAGTDEGLYNLEFGAAVWQHIEFKNTLSNQDNIYAFPTVIYPGFKSARFAYSISKSGYVDIEIFDFAMRKVRTVLKHGFRNAGERSDKSTADRWDGRDDSGRMASPGIYYFRITSPDGIKFGKVILYGAKDAGMEP